MAECANWQMQASVDGGPSLSLSDKIEFDAYDKVSVDITAGAGPITLEVQPGDDLGQVVLFMMKSTKYGEALAYTVNGGSTSFKLDAPLMVIGKGAVSLMDQTDPPQTVEVTNGLAEDVTVTVLVGRNLQA